MSGMRRFRLQWPRCRQAGGAGADRHGLPGSGLPDISGVQVALQIRGTPKGRKLPLIALTGLGRDEDRYLTRAAQFDEHVTKPLRIDDLVRITREVAERRDSA